MNHLWSANTPAAFWLCEAEVPEDAWQAAVQTALPILELSSEPQDIQHLLYLVLGEGQFGPTHWQLGPLTQLYYRLKPAIPRAIVRLARRQHNRAALRTFPLGWPIEDRYVRFQWEVLRQLTSLTGHCIRYRPLWPKGTTFAFVLTHDVETADGQAYVQDVAALEESLGFRSSFNFVLERYPLDQALIADLRQRGFEVGVHGLRHDATLFSSHGNFAQQAEQINNHLRQLRAAGFRSPLNIRNPAWMQALEIEYDLSFFDTDPFEPLPGGTMSIWPFTIGRFVELPYTLPQDFTLTALLGETTPRLWLEKVDFIERFQGMALLNSHPDYLRDRVGWKLYAEFLERMRRRDGYWHALPIDVARWWRAHAAARDRFATLSS